MALKPFSQLIYTVTELTSKLIIKFKDFSRTFQYQIIFFPWPFYFIDSDLDKALQK